MSWITFRRVQVAVPLVAIALAVGGCSGCADERENRRIDLGLRPGSERTATQAEDGDDAPAGDRPATTESADTAVPLAADGAEVETATSDTDTAVPGNGSSSEPSATASSAPVTGVGAPP